MPDWVWILIALGFLYEKWGKLRVFDFARGLIHIEFDDEKTVKRLPPTSTRKRLGK
jgi:hypothetical protein